MAALNIFKIAAPKLSAPSGEGQISGITGTSASRIFEHLGIGTNWAGPGDLLPGFMRVDHFVGRYGSAFLPVKYNFLSKSVRQ